jgi:hypothetical protein
MVPIAPDWRRGVGVSTAIARQLDPEGHAFIEDEHCY